MSLLCVCACALCFLLCIKIMHKLKRNATTIVLMLWLWFCVELVLFEPLIKTINKVSAIRLQSTVRHIERHWFIHNDIDLRNMGLDGDRYIVSVTKRPLHLRQRWNEWNFVSVYFFFSLSFNFMSIVVVRIWLLFGWVWFGWLL